MRTVTFQSVLNGVSQRGVSKTADACPSGTIATLISYIADRLRTAWEFYRWPETMALDDRHYRLAWASGSTYVSGNEVWFDDGAGTSGYYEANQSTTAGQSPVTHPSKWDEMDNFHRYVPFAQTGETEFAAVLNAWDADPRAYDTAAQVPFTITDEGVSFDQDAPDTIWLEYRLPAPNFDCDIYDSGTAYAVGRRLYYAPTYECYLVNTLTSAGETPVSAASKFTKIDFPMILARAVKIGALADYFMGDGHAERAESLEGREGDGDVRTFFGLMEEQVRQLVLIQGQRGTYQFQPSPSTAGSATNNAADEDAA